MLEIVFAGAALAMCILCFRLYQKQRAKMTPRELAELDREMQLW